MAKIKTHYQCQSCGAKFNRWMGRCSSCGDWNTLVEEKSQDTGKLGEAAILTLSQAIPVLLSEVESGTEYRISTGDDELNRVLGGGLVPGSLVLLGGEPGIGKSTLLLQTARQMPMPVWYVSGEESARQIKMRADRLPGTSNEVTLFTETELNRLLRQLKAEAPPLVIIDSIQTLYDAEIESAPGSVSQIRHSAAMLMRLAKEHSIALFLVGHITKEGSLAGPKILEHMVDTVLQFEGERHHAYRLLRTLKNRFGSTAELGIYQMQSDGLKGVSNPSAFLLTPAHRRQSGAAIAASLEGNRPMLIEIQVLVSRAAYGTPQRSATGFESRRLNMLLAVLEKRLGVQLSAMDVFLNVTGGLKTDDPAVDLAVCVATLSSFYDKAMPDKTCFAAEVGLGGELRPVSRLDLREQESKRLGFTHLIKARDFVEDNGAKSAFETLSELTGRLFGPSSI